MNNLTSKRRDDSDLAPPLPLDPSQEQQLYSFYAPDLEAGSHHITIAQGLDTNPNES